MIDKQEYPKVLVIGQSFNLKGGGGITLTNLFKGWPKDKIAVATTEDIDVTGIDYCEYYYQIGYLELKRPWPFYLIQSKLKSGPVRIQKNNYISVSENRKTENVDEVGIKGFYHKFLNITGIKPFIYRMNVSKEFMKWFVDYDPDVIYSQLSDFQHINFVFQIVERTHKPLAIHIMDDWPKTLSQPGLLYYYWKWKLNLDFRKLVNYADVLMSICPAMSEEYFKRYKRKFLPFQNTIDVNKFDSFYRKDWRIKGEFRLFYGGRIGRGTYNSILTIVKATEELGKKGLNIRFIIRTGRLPYEYKSMIETYKFTSILGYLDHNNIPEELSDMDVLIIPLDFTDIVFTGLSMPTKVPEYLASGTPIIIFAPKTTALFKYARSLRWGFTVTENDVGILAEGIEELFRNYALRKKLGLRSREVALQNHDGEKIRDQFRRALIKAI